MPRLPRGGGFAPDGPEEGLWLDFHEQQWRQYHSELEALAETAVAMGNEPKRMKVLDQFDRLPNLKASEVDLAIDRSGETLIIRARGKERRFHYGSIGFGDHRTGNQFGILWLALKRFMGHEGELSYWSEEVEESIRKNLKKQVQFLRRLLKEITGIEDAPFKFDKKRATYKMTFRNVRDLATDKYEFPYERASRELPPRAVMSEEDHRDEQRVLGRAKWEGSLYD